jgi:hypothetical protein
LVKIRNSCKLYKDIIENENRVTGKSQKTILLKKFSSKIAWIVQTWLNFGIQKYDDGYNRQWT